MLGTYALQMKSTCSPVAYIYTKSTLETLETDILQ